jgi:hypothetical protein
MRMSRHVGHARRPGPSLVATALGIAAMVLLGAAPAVGLPLEGAASTVDGGEPQVGDDPAEVDLEALGGIATGDGAAIPLRAEQPDWLTDELAEQVIAADEPVAAPPDAPLPGWIGIRPGSFMVAPAGCTMNFVFERGGDLAIGTAGHCVDRVGQEVILLTLAPDGETPVLIEIGPVLTLHDAGVGRDFALVHIPERYHDWVSPTVAVVGGPCGATDAEDVDSVWHYGHGLAVGTGGTPRAGVATHWERQAFGWAGAASFGDSGSAVRVTDLDAVGNLTHLVVNPDWLPSYIAGTRIAWMLRWSAGYDLVLSSLCPDGADGASGEDDGPRGDRGGQPEDRGGPPSDRGSGTATLGPLGIVDGWQIRLGVVW